MNTQLTPEIVDAALGDLDRPDPDLLPSATVVALRLADILTSDDPQVGAAFQAEMREHFDDGQILELGSALAVASGWQRFIEAFGIRPDQWTADMPAPNRPGS